MLDAAKAVVGEAALKDRKECVEEKRVRRVDAL